MSKLLLVFLSALAVSAGAMIVLRRMALSSRVLVAGSVVLVGGAGIATAFISASLGGFFLYGGIPSERIGWLMLIAAFVLACGIVDDICELSVAQKFCLQILAVVFLLAIDIRTHIVYIGFWGNVALTTFWILGAMNAFNLLDIMDGVSAGSALVITGALIVLGAITGHMSIQILSLALGGAVLGFLFFNVPPARIYLGNAGSHFLGFVLAALTLMISYATIDRPLALLSPIIILWLPLLETAFLIYFRLRKGMSPFQKSKDHMALRLKVLGWTDWAALSGMMGAALFFSFCGVIMSWADHLVGSVIVGIVILGSLGLFCMIKRADVHE